MRVCVLRLQGLTGLRAERDTCFTHLQIFNTASISLYFGSFFFWSTCEAAPDPHLEPKCSGFRVVGSLAHLGGSDTASISLLFCLVRCSPRNDSQTFDSENFSVLISFFFFFSICFPLFLHIMRRIVFFFFFNLFFFLSFKIDFHFICFPLQVFFDITYFFFFFLLNYEPCCLFAINFFFSFL